MTATFSENTGRVLNGFPIDLMAKSPQGLRILKSFFGGFDDANNQWNTEADEQLSELYRSGALGPQVTLGRYDEEDVEESGANPIEGNVFPEADGDDSEESSINNIFGNSYRSIVQGWNQKVVSNNVDLSSLIPFVELYTVFANDDIVYSDSINRFTGIKNRLIPVTFVAPPNSIAGSIPALPPNITPDSKLAKIGSVEGQLNNDYINYSNSQQSGGSYPPTDTVRSFRGQPGINDLSISRGSSGAFNIKYDIGITLPNPEIINDQYEYSKLLLPNSTFLIIHGWKITDTTFFADSYPPLLDPKSTEPVNVIIGGSNNGFWNTNITTLYNFNFEFDNVGHLVGKLSFISSQTALLANLQTSMIGSTMLNALKETDPNILARATGSNSKEKQNAIFANGVPWSRQDRAGGPDAGGANTEAAVASAIELAFRQASTVNPTATGSGSQNIGLNRTDLSEGERQSLQNRLAQIEGFDYDFDRAERIINLIVEATNQVAITLQMYEGLSARSPTESSTGDALDELSILKDTLLGEMNEIGSNYEELLGEDFIQNMYFNFFMYNYALENPELLFVPPENFETGSESAPILVFEDDNLTSTLKRDRARNVGRGYLTDADFAQFRPETAEPIELSTVAMPTFGSALQQNIFNNSTGFDSEKNLNYENLRSSLVQNGFVDEQLKDAIIQTSIFSLPVVRSEHVNNVLPDLSENFEENFDKSLFMIEYTSLGGNGQEKPRDTEPYQISFPLNSVENRSRSILRISGDNSFSFAGNPAPNEQELAVPIILNPTARPAARGAGGTIGTNARYVSSQVLILDSGFYISRERPLKNQAFRRASPPVPLLDDQNNFFIRGFDNFITVASENSSSLANDLRRLSDEANNYIMQSDAFRRASIGFSGNTDYELDGVFYNTYMRPAYFFLGSVLESLSIATNRTVKFYYKPFPDRNNNRGSDDGETIKPKKAFIINLPEQVGGDSSALSIIDDEIRAVEQEMIDNGYLEGVKSPLSNYNVDIPDEDLVDSVQLLYKQAWLEWTLALTQTILEGTNGSNSIIQELEQAGGPFLQADVEDFLSNSLIERIGDLRSTREEIDASRNAFLSDSTSEAAKFIPPLVNEFVDSLLANDSLRKDYERSINEAAVMEYNFFIFEDFDLAPDAEKDGADFIMLPGEYRLRTGSITLPTLDGDSLSDGEILGDAVRRTNYKQLHLNKRGGVPGLDSFDSRVTTIRDDYINAVVEGGKSRQQINIDRLAFLLGQKSELSVESKFKNVSVSTPFEVPINISTVEHMLLSEGNAPTHNLLKKVLDAVQETMPDLRLSMRTHSSDPSYIEVFASAINDDGIITEIMDEISINNLTTSDQTPDILRSTVIRDGSRVLSNNVTVLNFGTSDSLVESFQMSSRLDPMAFATSMTPAILGGASMNVSNILKESIINNDRDNVLSDIQEILENSVINVDDFKTLQIVSETENAEGKTINQVTDDGLNRLRNILVGENNNIVLQKTAMTLVEELATQNVTLRNKLTALQAEYFNGLDSSVNISEDLNTKIIPNSRYAGNILGTFLRSITVTIHGTAGFNIHDYVYIKGTMRGVEGLYIISNVNESVTIGSFTTTLECRLVQYTNNDQQTNPLAYRGAATIRALAEEQRKLASDAEVDIADLAGRLFSADNS